MSCARVDDLTGGLIDDQEILIVERHVDDDRGVSGDLPAWRRGQEGDEVLTRRERGRGL